MNWVGFVNTVRSLAWKEEVGGEATTDRHIHNLPPNQVAQYSDSSDQLGSNQAAGNYKLWDSLKDSPAYAVVASTAEHVQAAVRFAETNKLRLSIKNTGHDW